MDTYHLPELPYDYSGLAPAYDARALEIHHAKHHAAYVKTANETFDRLHEARRNGLGPELPGLECTLAFSVSGHVLHSLFWQSMCPGGSESPDGPLRDEIERCFGTVADCTAQLSAAVTSLQGSGWACLAWDALGGRLVVTQLHDHQDNGVVGSLPILVIDGWEHAFYLQYQNDKKAWTEAFWQIVDWQAAGARFEEARAARLLPSGPPRS